MQRTVLNRRRRGYATKERVQRHVPFLVSGPIGLARSHILTSKLIIISVHITIKFHHFRILFYYRNYCTKQSSRTYTSSIWVSRNLDKQILLMQLGIKQLL